MPSEAAITRLAGAVLLEVHDEWDERIVLAVADRHAVAVRHVRGIDVAAMSAAAEAGGPVVGVLAESLERRIRAVDTRARIANERLAFGVAVSRQRGVNAAVGLAIRRLRCGPPASTIVA